MVANYTTHTSSMPFLNNLAQFYDALNKATVKTHMLKGRQYLLTPPNSEKRCSVSFENLQKKFDSLVDTAPRESSSLILEIEKKLAQLKSVDLTVKNSDQSIKKNSLKIQSPSQEKLLKKTHEFEQATQALHEKVDQFLRNWDQYNFNTQHDFIKSYTQEHVALADKYANFDVGGIAKCYRKLGDFYKKITLTPEDKIAYKNAAAYYQQLSRKLSSSQELAVCYGNEGKCYRKAGDHNKAIELFLKAAELFVQLKKQENNDDLDTYIKKFYLKTGDCYRTLAKDQQEGSLQSQLFEKASEYYQKPLEI